MQTYMSNRLLGALLASSLLLTLGACATSAPAVSAEAVAETARNFTPDWREHSKPLFREGMGPDAGYQSWRVPETLPRGTYRVINRNGDTAKLIDGQRFEIDGSPSKRIIVIVSSGYNDVQALEEKYVKLAN